MNKTKLSPSTVLDILFGVISIFLIANGDYFASVFFILLILAINIFLKLKIVKDDSTHNKYYVGLERLLMHIGYANFFIIHTLLILIFTKVPQNIGMDGDAIRFWAFLYITPMTVVTNFLFTYLSFKGILLENNISLKKNLRSLAFTYAFLISLFIFTIMLGIMNTDVYQYMGI